MADSRRIFKIFDEDGSGSVSYNEYCHLVFPNLDIESYVARRRRESAAKRGSTAEEKCTTKFKALLSKKSRKKARFSWGSTAKVVALATNAGRDRIGSPREEAGEQASSSTVAAVAREGTDHDDSKPKQKPFKPPKPSSELEASVIQMTAPYLQELSREQVRIEQKLDQLIAHLCPAGEQAVSLPQQEAA
eukprot:1441675-Prymnesium_polylepis.1